MLKLIKWEFGSDTSKIKGTDLCINKVAITKGKWKGLQFSVSGLGLTKLERELFNNKFMEFTGIVNIYIGKWLITYNSKGIYNQLKNVNITYDKSILKALRSKLAI